MGLVRTCMCVWVHPGHRCSFSYQHVCPMRPWYNFALCESRGCEETICTRISTLPPLPEQFHSPPCPPRLPAWNTMSDIRIGCTIVAEVLRMRILFSVFCRVPCCCAARSACRSAGLRVSSWLRGSGELTMHTAFDKQCQRKQNTPHVELVQERQDHAPHLRSGLKGLNVQGSVWYCLSLVQGRASHPVCMVQRRVMQVPSLVHRVCIVTLPPPHPLRRRAGSQARPRRTPFPWSPFALQPRPTYKVSFF